MTDRAATRIGRAPAYGGLSFFFAPRRGSRTARSSPARCPDRPVPRERESRHDVEPTTGTLSIFSRDNALHSCYRTACDENANTRPSRFGPRIPFSSRRDETLATLPPLRHSPLVVVVVLLPPTLAGRARRESVNDPSSCVLSLAL